jgi:adenylosuccinate synthase
MVIDIEHLCGEIEALKNKGVEITPGNLKISDKAFVCLPYHKAQDVLEEERLGDKKYGSTRRGIAPVYGDKHMKKGLRLGDLHDPETIKQKLTGLVEWKNLTFKGYSNNVNVLDTLRWLGEYGSRLYPYITDISEYLRSAVFSSRNILFEAQLGALRDIDYGIYPYTTSSHTLASYATTGAGLPGAKLNRVIGVMKAYSSCVGEGPFVVEMAGTEAEILREAGAEYGAATGRPRRVGGFDVVASRYGVQTQGADEIALTKLDILSYMDKIPVCIAYKADGEEINRFPSGDKLSKCKPVFQYLDGWRTDISKCRKVEDLPNAALRYIRFIEDAVDCPIRYVSVGAGRDEYLELR